MSRLSPIWATIADLDPLKGHFPFIHWATGAKFDHPAGARHLFCKTGSAAEAFFFRPFAQRAGVRFESDCAVLSDIRVYPQYRVANYRIDFALMTGSIRLALEVDGLAFHQRNGEQIEDDYLRARRLIAAGYIVVRFAAREAFRDPGECWRQVDGILTRLEGH